MPRPLRMAAFVAMGLTLGVGPFAFADASPARLVYERGAGADACPDEAGLRRDVAARLGHDPFVESADRTVSARIVRDGAKLRGTIELLDAAGKVNGARALESKQFDCKELASAMSLAISLALDPLAGAPPKPSASVSVTASASASPVVSASASALPPPPRPPPAPSAAPLPAPPPDRGLRVSLGVFGGAGFAPSPNLGFSAAVGYRTARWSLEVEGRRDLPSTSTLGVGTVTSSILGFSLVPCLVRGPLGICALITVGALQASGGDVATPRSEAALWAAAGIRLSLQWTLWGPLAVGLHADGLAPFMRSTLKLNGEEVYSTSSVAGTLGLRFVVHFE